MIISQRTWRSLIGLMMMIVLITIVPCATDAKSSPRVKRSIQSTAKGLQLLQKSLSITELDKDINQILVHEKAAVQERKRLEIMLQRQEKAFEQKREQAGRVLCSYYIGERDSILQAILTSTRVHHLFLRFEYLQLLFQTDYERLNDYKEQISVLYQLRNENAQLEKKLLDVRTRLVLQRDRLIKLQKQLDADVSASNNPAAMTKLIQQFTSYWQNIGLAEVRYYFRALAKSIGAFPHFIKNNSDISMQGTNYTITIREELLNQFLWKQDPMFQVLTFQFKDGVVIAKGERSNMSVRVEGHYTIESEPVNHILFHIDRTFFNGLQLPESTRRDLEQSVDLSFYPKKLVPFLKAKEVTIANKMIVVKLSLSL